MTMAVEPPVSSNSIAGLCVWLSHRRGQARYSMPGEQQQRHRVGMNNLTQVKEVLGFMGTYFVLGLRITLTNEDSSGLGEDLTFEINRTKTQAQSHAICVRHQEGCRRKTTLCQKEYGGDRHTEVAQPA